MISLTERKFGVWLHKDPEDDGSHYLLVLRDHLDTRLQITLSKRDLIEVISGVSEVESTCVFSSRVNRTVLVGVTVIRRQDGDFHIYIRDMNSGRRLLDVGMDSEQYHSLLFVEDSVDMHAKVYDAAFETVGQYRESKRVYLDFVRDDELEQEGWEDILTASGREDCVDTSAVATRRIPLRGVFRTFSKKGALSDGGSSSRGWVPDLNDGGP